MKRLLSILLAGAMLLCAVTVLADSDGAGQEAGEAGGSGLPRFVVPVVPTVEVPEIPEIEVPEVPEATETPKPTIEVPEIPALDVPQAEPTDAPEAAWRDAEIEAALDALGVEAYRAVYEALRAGEPVGEGSGGDAARGLQQLLADLGQDIRVDGIVGPKSIAALNAVQAECGLPKSKKLDAEGLAALLSRLLAVAGETQAP